MVTMFPVLKNSELRSFLLQEPVSIDDDGNQTFQPSRAQKLVRKFLGGDSPYRGLLLYHKLGAGKTCAAIGIAETIHASEFQKVIVVLPAALEPNFVNEIFKCGSTRYHGQESLVRQKYHFLHFNGLTKKKVLEMQKQSPPYFDNAVVIVDEAHNITKSVVKQESFVMMALFKMIASAKNSKVIVMTGTPMVNDAAEIAYIMTMVKGLSIRYRLKYPHLSRMNVIGIDEYLRHSHPCVVRHGFDMKQDVIWIDMLPDSFRYYDPKSRSKLVRRHPQDANNLHVLQRLNPQKIEIVELSPFELDAEKFDTLYVNENTDLCRPEMQEDFMQRVFGFVSFYQPDVNEVYPGVRHTHTVRCPMSDLQFDAYVLARTREIDMEKRQAKIRRKDDDGKNGSISVYRTFSRRACNFAFPSGIKRLFQSDIKRLTGQNVDDAQYAKHLRTVMKQLDSIPSALSVEHDLKFTSPKYFQLIENIHLLTSSKEYSGYGTALIYSSFRNVLEGLPIIQRVLDKNGFEEFNIHTDKKRGISISNITPNKKRYILFDSAKENPPMIQLLRIFNNELGLVDNDISIALQEALKKAHVPFDNMFGDIAQILIISEAGSEGISLKNVRQVHVIEPYWQRVRIQQVVGRAVRAYSHHSLPLEYRNVDVYLYISEFTQSQIKSVPSTLKKADQGVTTDQHLMNISMKKGKTIDSFVELLKRAAVDCPILQPNRKDCFYK